MKNKPSPKVKAEDLAQLSTDVLTRLYYDTLDNMDQEPVEEMLELLEEEFRKRKLITISHLQELVMENPDAVQEILSDIPTEEMHRLRKLVKQLSESEFKAVFLHIIDTVMVLNMPHGES